MTTARYAIARAVDLPFDEADRRVREALADEGFGILTEIDVKATLKKKLDVDMERYVILGACNPPLAHRAIQQEPDIGLLLPCNVVVRETPDGTVIIEAMDPVMQLSIADNDELAPLADDVRERVQRAVVTAAEGAGHTA